MPARVHIYDQLGMTSMNCIENETLHNNSYHAVITDTLIHKIISQCHSLKLTNKKLSGNTFSNHLNIFSVHIAKNQ